MNSEERELLLHIARWVAEQEEKSGESLGGSMLAREIRQLVEKIRPK